MALTSSQKIIYLANVISVGRADNKLSKSEEDAFENIHKVIGAKKTNLKAAYKKAEDIEFTPTPVGNWSDKIKNFEDMILVSMIDGLMDVHEKELLIKFAKQIGISQEQLKLIQNDVKNTLSEQSRSLSCPNCEAEINQPAKFCPECGSSTEKKITSESTKIDYDIPLNGISIEFAESTSGRFSMALKDYEKAPLHDSCVKGKKTWYIATWPKDSISETLSLVENLSGLRNRRAYIDGKETPWTNVFGFSWCAKLRKSAYRPIEYCFGLDDNQLNVCGCKHGGMDWLWPALWMEYGSYRESGMFEKTYIFVFDKKRIRHELEKKLYEYRFCPHLEFKLIEAILDVLPDKVTPSENGPWQYRIDGIQRPGCILIKGKIQMGDFDCHLPQQYSSSVKPASIHTAIDLLRKAFDVCGYQSNEIQHILNFKG